MRWGHSGVIEVDQIIHGNTLSVLNTLPSESIDCVITSPPYWGLRDYGIEGQLGLEPTFNEYIINLQTIFDEVYRVLKKTGTCWVDIGDTYASTPRGKNSALDKVGDIDGSKHDAYYRSIGRDPQKQNNPFIGLINQNTQGGTAQVTPKPQDYGTVQMKSLCNIPHRFAISMTDHNWIQRNTIIWHKPSCMPSSAKDRFTVDFEYVFLFSKSKKYYFEQQFEAYADITLTETKYNGQATKDYESAMAQNPSDTKRRVINSIDTNRGRNKRTVWRVEDNQEYWTEQLKTTCQGGRDYKTLKIWLEWVKDNPNGTYEEFYNVYYGKDMRPDFNEKYQDYKSKYAPMHKYLSLPNPRGKRLSTLWRINPQPFREAHFAVFPEKLVEPMIKAGCPSAICDSCGIVYETITNNEYHTKRETKAEYSKMREIDSDHARLRNGMAHDFTATKNTTVKKCDCDAPTHAGTVLDPFVGSGTTALVARKLGRHYIGIDLNADYCEMARKRLSEVL